MRTILLAHGVLGFSKIGATPYFNGVEQCWPPDAAGNPPRFLRPAVAPAGSIEARAKTLQATIEGALSADELARGKIVHIVAHSMGGLDARYLISPAGLGRAKWVASLTTLSTPHRGSALADIVTGRRFLSVSDLVHLAGAVSHDTLASILRSLGKAPASGPLGLVTPLALFDALRDIGHYIHNLFGTPPSAFEELTTEFVSAFTEGHNDLQGVPFLCFAGQSGPHATMCRELYAPWLVLRAISGDNDGAVAVSSSSLGSNVRTIPADHFEEVGLADFFDGLPPMKHYPLCDVYRQIDAWQRSIG